MSIILQVGISPLIQAAQDGHLDMVKVLIEQDAELDIDHRTEVNVCVVS